MPKSKTSKTKVKKASKKSVSPRSKKTPRSTEAVVNKGNGILLSTEISGSSVAHGHAPYQHSGADSAAKKMDERSKSLIMYIGVGLVMIVIVVFWIMSLKSTLGPDAFSISSAKPQSKTDFDDLKNNLNKTLSDVKTEIQTLEEQAKAKANTPTTSATFAPTSTVTPTSVVTPSATFKSITVTDTVKSKSFNTLPN